MRALVRVRCDSDNQVPETSRPQSQRTSQPYGASYPGLNRRRAITGFSLASAAALGGNLGGVTTAILSVDGGATAEALRLDTLVPIRTASGIFAKRSLDQGNGYTFLYPADWLADQASGPGRHLMFTPCEVPSFPPRAGRTISLCTSVSRSKGMGSYRTRGSFSRRVSVAIRRGSIATGPSGRRTSTRWTHHPCPSSGGASGWNLRPPMAPRGRRER